MNCQGGWGSSRSLRYLIILEKGNPSGSKCNIPLHLCGFYIHTAVSHDKSSRCFGLLNVIACGVGSDVCNMIYIAFDLLWASKFVSSSSSFFFYCFAWLDTAHVGYF